MSVETQVLPEDLAVLITQVLPTIPEVVSVTKLDQVLTNYPKSTDLTLYAKKTDNDLTNYTNNTQLGTLLTEYRSLVDAVQRNLRLNIWAYHMGSTPGLPSPYVICDACWIFSDGTFVVTRINSLPDWSEIGPPPALGDYTFNRFVWREWMIRQIDKAGYSGTTQYQIKGYGQGDGTGNSGLSIVPATATQPRGVRIAGNPGPAKLLLTRTRPTAHTYLMTFTITRGNMWWVRLGVGQLWFIGGLNDGFMMQRWPGSGNATDIGPVGVGEMWLAPDPPWLVRAVGMSVDTVNNKICFITDYRVYEYESPTSNHIYGFTTNPTAASVGHSPVTISAPIASNALLKEVDFAKWKNGTFLGNDNVTREVGPDPVNWDPTTSNTWTLGMGALDSWEPDINSDMIVYEVRNYDRYLNRTQLAAEWSSIRMTSASRTDPPTSLPTITY